MSETRQNAARRDLLAALLGTALLTLTVPGAAAPIVAGVARNVPLSVPEPRKITGYSDPAEVREAIVEVAERLHWRILCQIQPGSIRMVYLRGDRLELDIDVRYSTTGYEIRYLGSRGLYEEKDEAGHIRLQPKGNVLMADLDRVVGRRLGAGLPAPSGEGKGAH